MERRLIVVLICVCLATFVSAQKIKGSDTMLPVSQKEAEAFMAKDKSHSVTVTGGGSGIGITALLDETTDLAQTSRRIKFSEKKKIRERGHEVVEIVACYDALAVIVNLSNPIDKLTRKELEDIFTGKITNWKELGGEDRKIIAYARETSSGTYEFFQESVMKRKNYKSGIMNMPTTGAVIQSVSQTKGAIGYVGLAYLNPKVKALKVSWDNGKTYLEPSLSNATYPIKRPLYYYYLSNLENKVKDFLEFVLSEDGQLIVLNLGFIPIKK